MSTSNGVASIAVVGSGIVETGTVDICVEGLCYEDQEGNRGLEVSYGSTTGKGSGLPASIELSSSVPSIQVKGTGGTETATITAKVYDETGNPIKDSYTSGDGSTTEGSPVFVSYSAKFVTRGFSADDELTIHSGDDAGTYQIISVDSEMQVTLNSNMTQDSDAVNFTATVQDNIVFSLSGPGGGENLDGETSAPFTSTKSTVDGQASVTLNSGVLSGTVTIQADCTQGGSTATAISPQIGIEAGPPFNISLYKAPDIEDNGDGSMSWIISAMLQDQYGNPVANDTGVYFGLVDNQPDGYKSSGANGITDGTATFVSAGTNFPGDGVVKFDTLIILEGQDEGGNTIDTPAHGSVTLFYTPTGSETDLDFVAGNAELGVVCGVVPTGNLEPDTTCTPSGGIAIKGVAHTRLTWAEPAIFKPFYLYAETEGRNLGKTFGKPYSYPGIEPVAIDITLDPASVFAGEEFITVNAHFHDGATPSHNIREEELTFTTDNTNISGFGGIGAGFETTTDDTNDNGVAVTTLDVVTNDCIDSERNVTISVSHEQYMGTATLTIKATAPTANFSSTDGGNHNTVFFVDSSTTVAGTSITDWEWDFDGDSSTIESTVRSPTYNFGTANDYTVTLTVTNDFGCTDSLTKVITVP